jgi:hypothetical protein
MGTGKRRINSAVRVLLIAQVAELEHAQVVAELEHAQVVVELVLAQVAAERVLAQVAAVLEHDPVVAAERVLAQVAAERELARVEVVPELDPLRARLAGVLKTKSVTGVPRHDLVLIAAEDLAAAAETTRVPAATEAAVAWAVADIVVVVAEDAAAEE